MTAMPNNCLIRIIFIGRINSKGSAPLATLR